MRRATKDARRLAAWEHRGRPIKLRWGLRVASAAPAGVPGDRGALAGSLPRRPLADARRLPPEITMNLMGTSRSWKWCATAKTLRYRVRLAGTRTVYREGGDNTGKFLDDVFRATSRTRSWTLPPLRGDAAAGLWPFLQLLGHRHICTLRTADHAAGGRWHDGRPVHGRDLSTGNLRLRTGSG